jgi:hypothetical protein
MWPFAQEGQGMSRYLWCSIILVVVATAPAFAQAPSSLQPLFRQQPYAVSAKGYAELDALGMACYREVAEKARALIAPELRDMYAWRAATQGPMNAQQRATQEAGWKKALAEIDAPLAIAPDGVVTRAAEAMLGSTHGSVGQWRNNPTNPNRMPDYFARASNIFGAIALNCYRRELYQRGFVSYAPDTCSLNGAPVGGAIFMHPRALYQFIAQRCSYQPGLPRGAAPAMIPIPSRIGDPFKMVPPSTAPPPQNAGTGPPGGGTPPGGGAPPTGPPPGAPPPREDPSLLDRLWDQAIEAAAVALVDTVDEYEARLREMGLGPLLFEELRARSVTWGLGFVDDALDYLKLPKLDNFLDPDSYAQQEARQNRLALAQLFHLDILLTPKELEDRNWIEYWEKRAKERGWGPK